MTMSKIVMTIQIQLIHNYVFVIRNCVMMNVMIVNLGLDLMDSNVITAIQKIHGAMISMKFWPKETVP